MKIKSKAGKINAMNPSALITGLVFAIILFGVLEVVIPNVNTSLNHLAGNNTGVPFISFFAGNGLIVLMLMAGVLLGVVALFIGSRGKK